MSLDDRIDENDPQFWDDSNPLKVKCIVAQRDEFRRRTLTARQALIDARYYLETGDMEALRAVLVANTPFICRPPKAGEL